MPSNGLEPELVQEAANTKIKMSGVVGSFLHQTRLCVPWRLYRADAHRDVFKAAQSRGSELKDACFWALFTALETLFNVARDKTGFTEERRCLMSPLFIPDGPELFPLEKKVLYFATANIRQHFV